MCVPHRFPTFGNTSKVTTVSRLLLLPRAHLDSLGLDAMRASFRRVPGPSMLLAASRQSHGDKLGFPRVSSFQFSLDICFLPPGRMLVLTVPRFDSLDGVHKRFFQNPFADASDHETKQPSLEVFAVAYDGNVDVGLAIRTTCEVIGVA